MKNQNENYFLSSPYFDLGTEYLQNVSQNNLQCHNFINKETEVWGGSEISFQMHTVS